MHLPSFAAWTWIPIVIGAALAQTIRNATQRTLTSQLGTLPATLVRFLYGLPFTVLWLLLVIRLSPAYREPIHFGAAYFAWLTLGATAQLAATALLLLAMKERNFVVAVAYSKTEVLQVALFATLFLNELPTLMAGLAMLIATAGVVMLSLPKIALPGGFTAKSLLSKLALYGLGSGACFALASVGYRGAAILQTGTSPWLTGAWGVLWAQLIQTALLGGYLARQQPGALLAIARAWRLSSLAGTMGAMASIGWFTATALRPVADVRTLGLVEVLFSFLVSHRLFNEKLSNAERIGLVLVTAGLVIICAQL